MLVHRASENNELLFNDTGKKNFYLLKTQFGALSLSSTDPPSPSPPPHFQVNKKIRKAKGSSSYFLDACEEP